MLTFCVDIFGFGGLVSNSDAYMVSLSKFPSGNIKNNGESHLFFPKGSSYRITSSSNTSRLYFSDSFFLLQLNSQATSLLISAWIVH